MILQKKVIMDSCPKTDSFFHQSCLCMCLPAPDVWVRSGEWSVFCITGSVRCKQCRVYVGCIASGQTFRSANCEQHSDRLPNAPASAPFPALKRTHKHRSGAVSLCWKVGIHLVGRIVTTSLAWAGDEDNFYTIIIQVNVFCLCFNYSDPPPSCQANVGQV